MKNQKGNVALIVVIVAVILLAGGYYVYHKMTKQYMMQQPTAQSQNTIQNDSQLQSVSNDLDNTNVDSMDTELNQNTQDASSF